MWQLIVDGDGDGDGDDDDGDGDDDDLGWVMMDETTELVTRGVSLLETVIGFQSSRDPSRAFHFAERRSRTRDLWIAFLS